jgi:O-antigen/teichoic acid export membrane protein
VTSSSSDAQPTRSRRRLGLSPGALKEMRPMAGLSAAEGGARLLSFAFYLLAARALAPTDFGVVRYTITLSLVAFVGLQVLVKALMKEIGGARADPERVREVLGTGVLASVLVLAVSGALTIAASAIGLTGSAQPVGLVAVLAGTACFQLYYAMGRGVGEVVRPAVTYVGASACQLAAFVALTRLGHPSVSATLWVYGASGAVPLLGWELARPLLRRNRLRVTRDAARLLWRISAPLVVGQVAYIVWYSADQIWVESALGTTQVGLYAAAKNLCQVFVVLPAGVNGALLPRMAELRAARRTPAALRLLYRTTLGLVAASAAVAVALVALRVPLLDALYGDAYAAAAGPLAGLAVAMTIYAGHFTLTGSAIGLGRPGISTATICVAAAVEVLVFALAPGSSATFAAWCYAGSIGAASLLALVLMARADRRLRAE